MRTEPPPVPTQDRDAVLARYLSDRAVHVYGIADVVQLWERSRWWLAPGGAVVGILDLPGAPTPVLYAVSADAQDSTLQLLRRLAPVLPDHFVATGPDGMAAGLQPAFAPKWATPYEKMHLAEPELLPPEDARVAPLGRADLDGLERLFATDPDAGDFFHPGLLDTGLYVGIREGGDLVAAAGTHVLEPTHGVAAVGNVVTHPAHRRLGLARAVVGTLCRRLLTRVNVVGLNVRRAGAGAQALYGALGFRALLPYEEAELVRHQRPLQR